MENNENLQNNNNIANGKETKKEKKYKLKYSQIIEQLRQYSDKFDKINYIEFTTNLLLMSSQINTTNKISCLTILSYINYEKRNALFTYYINKKIFKYLQIQKSIESFIYIRTLYRAAFHLNKEKNYFYAKKIINEAESLSKNSKIDNDSIKLLNNIKLKVEKGINETINNYIKKFRNIEIEENLTQEKYIKLKNLFKELNENTYKQNHLLKNSDNNNYEDPYLYIISKDWLIKAFLFFYDYQKERERNLNDGYFLEAFKQNNCYQNYFNIKEDSNKNKIVYKYNPFPCSIDNYSIINWKDIWYDPSNEDENYVLKKNLEEGKDYFLLEKNDFYFLTYFFGITNVLKRKKNCMGFIEVKTLIIDETLCDKENYFLLRKKHLQIRKNYTIKHLKGKIIRCIEYNTQKEKIIRDKLKIKQEKKEKKEKEKQERTAIEEEEDEVESDEIMINENMDINNYNIYFSLLEKNKKDILIEICISLSNKLEKYETINLLNIPIKSEDDYILNLLSNYDINKYILIIELQTKTSPKFISQISPINSTYYCSLCKNPIKSLINNYKCNICNYSLFCSEYCASKDIIHSQLDEIYVSTYLYEQFDLDNFLKINKNNLLSLFQPGMRKGLIGLNNLGNTCYINSTIQCLSNSFDLTKYFLLEYYKNDINTGNKLGSNGIIAKKYYSLINKMWFGTDNKIKPSAFIDNFKKLKKQFEGYRQQDAQEFLSVLLDQLHEDLNRITDKPYIELLEKQNNEDDLIASKRWWDLHKKREDSIIIDLFNGQFKSETICQVCNKSSITYDPFMSLCFPVPKAHKKSLFKILNYNTITKLLECIYLDFPINENSSIADLKKAAINFILESKKGLKFDLETVLFDSNLNIVKIIQTDIRNQNFEGQKKVQNLIINNEIVFYIKNNTNDDQNLINFFIYPIEAQKPDKDQFFFNNSISQIKFITYPLFFQLKNDTTIKELYDITFNRIKESGIFLTDRYQFFAKNSAGKRILEINIMHGKDTKNENFFSYFLGWGEETCKFCGESNKYNYYCSILNLGATNKTIQENLKNFKKPVVLLATSECYNLSGEKQIYSNCPLITSYVGHNLSNKFTMEKVQLKDCLDLFISNGNFQEDDSWFCSNCKKLEKSKKILQIYKPPNYLIILLKRYDLKHKSGNYFFGEKNNTFIDYPINDFDIREYIVGPEKNKAIYDLYGVIEHSGTLSQGHYTAMCKNNNIWINYNDSVFSQINNPVSKNAYVLFYKMKNIDA